MPGILTVGAVHIGNKMDMSPNIINNIINHDVIAVESIDYFEKLLFDLNIKTNAQLIEIGSYAHKKYINEVINTLNKNKNVLLLSDRGTAAFHDPGSDIVNAAINEDIEVKSIPGPNSLISALVISGLVPNKFIYGSCPETSDENQYLLNQYKKLKYPIIFLCNPQNVGIILKDTLEVLGEDAICVACFELTTIRERVFRSNAKDMLRRYHNNELYGESVIIISTPTWISYQQN